MVINRSADRNAKGLGDSKRREWSSVRYSIPGVVFLLALVAGLAIPRLSTGTSDVNELCLDCHSDDELTTDRGGRAISLYVDDGVFTASVHGGLDCIDCHQDVDPEDLPHAETLEPVFCGNCHDDVQVDFDASIHGQALNRKEAYAPRCKDCHGIHDIQHPSDPTAVTYKMNVPALCGGCHREGAPVARAYEIGQHNIVENYSQSIHGEGMFKKGLTVTATCNDCHGSHLVLPHTDPRSSINPGHVAQTCMKCHSRIEEVHVQVIRGELWEKSPGAIPSCIDCHLPHKVRKEALTVTLGDRDCLKCHENPTLTMVHAAGDTLSLFVERRELANSVHENIPCVKCHSDVDPRRDRPCETAGRADCSNCHAKMSEEYAQSGHGLALARGVAQAPYCTTCHDDHGVLSHTNEDSRTFRSEVPTLCGECHRTGGKASEVADLHQTNAITDYSNSVHGRGLTEKGLLPSAICIDCHGAHLILKEDDPRSSVFARNVPATCSNCHRGIYKDFTKSIHFDPEGNSKKKLPTCTDCHSAHTIGETGMDEFMTEVTTQCGSCHTELGETYLETMHGKAYQLGYLQAARCSDCHGSHRILGHDDPESSVGFRNIVGTCQQCHEDANARFTGYLTHATHHDPDRYPILYWTYRIMTGLLVGVFGFFGLHTLLWLPRSFKQYRDRRRQRSSHEGRYYVKRFSRAQRITHLFVILSFLSLALTGMMLKFSGMTWAAKLSDMLGGVRVAGNIHRVAAVMTFGYFVFHIGSLIVHKRRRRLSLRKLIFGPDSMMPNMKDLKDFWGSIKWFVGAGPRPQYGRFTYWEKFDYLAVFWGVAVIGLSGLMLWLPVLFTKFVPGWVINVATIIHSDEALLAVGFIFTVHFFNTHLRPEAFPMDTVVFTGVAPLEEYKADRPHEYAAMRERGELSTRVVKIAPSRGRGIAVRIVGSIFLGFGLILIGLILYSVLFGYKM